MEALIKHYGFKSALGRIFVRAHLFPQSLDERELLLYYNVDGRDNEQDVARQVLSMAECRAQPHVFRSVIARSRI